MALLCRALRHRSAHWRYLLWGVVLLKCVVPALFLVPVPVLHRVVERAVLVRHAESPVAPAGPDLTAVSPRLVSNIPEPMSQAVWGGLDLRQWLLAIWGAGMIGFLIVAMAKALRIQCDLKQARTLPDMELEREFLELVKVLKLRSRPKLCLIRGISQPFVWGAFRGCIYLPDAFAGQGTAQQRRLVIAHKLAHVLRWDALVNLLQVLIQAMFWFHPLVWWLNRMIRHEREKCCDEMAIASLRVDSREYGSAIVDRLAAHFEPACPSSSLAISGRAKGPGRPHQEHPATEPDVLPASYESGRGVHSPADGLSRTGALFHGGADDHSNAGGRGFAGGHRFEPSFHRDAWRERACDGVRQFEWPDCRNQQLGGCAIRCSRSHPVGRRGDGPRKSAICGRREGDQSRAQFRPTPPAALGEREGEGGRAGGEVGPALRGRRTGGASHSLRRASARVVVLGVRTGARPGHGDGLDRQ